MPKLKLSLMMFLQYMMYAVWWVPLVIKKFGLRKTMILGLVALAIRYFSFYAGGVVTQPWMYYIGILIHGLIFGFFYVGGQIYIDKKAPSNLKSQAQGFIFLVTFGLGLLLGNFISANLIDYYKTADGYQWDAIWGVTTLVSLGLLILFTLLFKEEKRSDEPIVVAVKNSL